MGLINYIKTGRYIKQYAEKSVVIFSEGRIYYTTNKPVIDELIKEIDVLYITIEENDELLSFEHERFHPVYLDFDFWGQLLMATIKGKVLATTTYSLDVLALKKSKFMKHYSCLLHSCCDIHAAQKYSFDYFDSVICFGEFQKIPLKLLEKKRNMPVKEKPVLGLPFYDIYYKEFNHAVSNNSAGNNRKYVLVAPSWGVNNFFNYIDFDIFEIIFEAGYDIIYRPHPMTLRLEQDLYNRIVKKYANGYKDKVFIVDTEKSSHASVTKSVCAVSAVSGFMYDYIIFAQKPLIYFDISKRDISKLDECDLQELEFWDTKMLKEVGYKVSTKEDIFNFFNNQLKNDNKNELRNTFRTDIVNLGDASKYIAEYLINKMK